MPTNLNALIRYKQIDRDLRNPYLKSTIKSLQESCSNQLAEHRGIYKLISERTIRDDIRVMRSDALGFNAPIIVKDSVYSYENNEYAILESPIDQTELLKEVFAVLTTEKDSIKNPKVDLLIERIGSLIGEEPSRFEDGISAGFSGSVSYSLKPSENSEKILPELSFEYPASKPSLLSKLRKKLSSSDKNELNIEKTTSITWKAIFELI